MKLRLLLLFAFAFSPLLIVKIGDAGIYLMRGGAERVIDTSDVGAYFNCDSVTSGQTITKGTGTVTIGASVTLITTAPINNGLSHAVGNAAGRVSLSSTNINPAEGCAGWYWYPETNSAGTVVYISTFTTGQQMRQVFQSGSGYLFRYKNLLVSVSIPADQTYFVEWCWDSDESSGFSSRARINGGTWVSTVGASGADPSLTSTIVWGPLDGNAAPGWFDQIMISSNPVKDLYFLRSQTSF